MSRNGICVFFDSLREPSIDSEAAGRVHVLPGHIEGEKGRYYQCSDRNRDWDEGPRSEEWFHEKLDLAADICGLDLYVKDTVRALELDYRFIDNKGRVTGSLGPATLASEAAYCRGFSKCPKGNGCSLVNKSTPAQVSEDSRIWVYRILNPESSCAAVVSNNELPKELFLLARGSVVWGFGGYQCVIQGFNCLDCCIRVSTLILGQFSVIKGT